MKIVFLHMQKTGGQSIKSYLKKIFLPAYLSFSPHQPICLNDYDKNNIYLTTIRNPFNLYKSFYQYGCEKKGGLYNNLSDEERKKFYDKTQNGYNKFVNFLLDKEKKKPFGFMTRRFLVINTIKEKFAETQKIHNRSELNKFYSNNKIFTHIIKNEELEEHFKKFIIECQNKFKNIYLTEDLQSKLKLLFTIKKNISEPLPISNKFLPQSIKEEIFRQESLIFENFYPNELLNIDNFSE
jgi:hypothetical protein